MENSLLFPASHVPLGEPASRGVPAFRTEHLTTADRLTLTFWAAPAQPDMPTIIDFHGNGSRASDDVPALLPLVRAGYGVVAAEYRGYAGNPGAPSEAGLLADARAYAAWAAARGIARPVLLGQSLGTGVAVALAAEHTVMGVILDSPYTSIPDVVANGPLSSAPTSLLRNRFDSLARIGHVTAPLLVIDGLADTVIPPDQGKRLFAAAPCPWQALFLPGVPHLAIGNDTSGAARAAILQFLHALPREGSCPAHVRDR